MLKSYFKLAVRNLLKYKVNTLVNVAGLVIAFTSCIFITLFVLDELNYDGFHTNAEQIYRVRQKLDMFGFSPTTSWLLGEKLINDFPEIKTAARIQPMDDPIYFKSGMKSIKENKYLFADNSLFEIFSLPLKYGDIKTALTIPHSVVINQEMAGKYFGEQNPIQQILNVNIRSKWYQLQVTGVLEDVPSNSDFDVDFIFSLSVLSEMKDKPGRKATEPHPMESWGMISSFTYVLLDKSGKVDVLEEKMNNHFRKNLPGSYINELKLEALKDIHLYKITNEGNQEPGSITYIYLYSATGVLILLIACINFVILSTAGASVRAKEIGMRKVIGARRADLVKQFLSESILLAFLALPLALFAVELFMPWVSTLLNKQFDTNYFQLWQFILILSGITLLVGLFSGGYVAFYLSALPPITAIKNYLMSNNSRGGFRKALIVTQFVIFVTLLVGSIVIYRQMRYVSESNPGFNREQLIAIDMGQVDFGKYFDAYKHDALQNPGIVSVSAGSTLPSTKTTMLFQSTSFQNKPGEKIQYLAGHVDYDFFKTLKASIVQGREFSPDFSGDLSESVIINQTAVKKFGLDNAVGSMISLQDGPKRVIGVVEDFVVSCYYETSPLVYYLKPGSPMIGTIIIRLQPGKINTTLKYLEARWYKYAPNAVFNFQFFDEELNKQYADDLRFGKIITVFTGLAIFIASLGLFGLSLFMIKRKNKETGIRKILGASIYGLIYIHTKEMIYLVIIGCITAWPIAYYFMSKWLEDFAYRIELSWWMFALSGGIAFVIALATVSFQAIKAATVNPIESLRHE